MRGLLIDYVRSRRALNRGGVFEITSLPTELPAAAAEGELDGIAEALDALGAVEPRLAQLVDLKFFCGFSFAEIAELQGISERTAQRDWDKARILLQRQIRGHEASPPEEPGRESALLTLLVLSGATVVTTLQTLEARRQRDLARAQLARAEAK